MKRILLALLVIISGNVVRAVKPEVLDSLRVSLAGAPAWPDSLKILYNIFDASSRTDRRAVAETIYQQAVVKNDLDTQLDLLLQLANFTGTTDSLFRVYKQRMKEIPYSNRKRNISMFITARQASQAARSATEEQSRERIHELLSRSELNNSRNLEMNIEIFFTLCAYLEKVPNGQLFSEYVQQLGDIIEDSPVSGYPMNTLYNTQSALTYTAIGEHALAVEADRELLRLVGELEDFYSQHDRPYKDFSYNHYISNRRMLSNFEALSPEEVEECYTKLKELAANDTTFARDFYTLRIPDMYYALAHKDYKTALPLLKNIINNNVGNARLYRQLEMLDYVIEVADSLGDRESLVEAVLMSRKLRNSDDVKNNINVLKELKSILEINRERLERTQVELEKRNVQLRSHRLVRIFAVLLLLLLLVFVLYLIRTWRRSSRLNLELEKSNERLKEERDSLKRTQTEVTHMSERARQAYRQRDDFIANLSHEVLTPLNAISEYSQLIVDCGDAEKKPYLNRFSDVIKLNTSLVLTLVNDVLDLASLDRGMMKIEKTNVVIGRLAAIAIDSIKSRITPGVQLVNTIDPEYSQVVVTDGKRVLQVLLNLLMNAAKFTTEGKITLAGEMLDDRRAYRFTVTDTGIGIPAGKEEVIFERFEKLNRHSQGLGLGLAVSRLVASLLGGEVMVDTNYRGPGARFAFIVPVE